MLTLASNLEPHRPHIETYYAKARSLLPELPEHMSFQDNNDLIIPGYPTGGYAFSPSTIKLGIDDTWEDKAALADDLRGTILHETYHIVQGYTGEVIRIDTTNFEQLDVGQLVQAVKAHV